MFYRDPLNLSCLHLWYVWEIGQMAQSLILISFFLATEAVPRTWHMKPELHCNPVGVPAGALSPPATLSPPGSPSVITLPSSPWSPGVPGSSSSTIANAPSGLCQAIPNRLSAFTLVSNYNHDLRLQSLPLSANAAARGNLRIHQDLALLEMTTSSLWEFRVYCDAVDLIYFRYALRLDVWRLRSIRGYLVGSPRRPAAAAFFAPENPVSTDDTGHELFAHSSGIPQPGASRITAKMHAGKGEIRWDSNDQTERRWISR